MFCAFHIYHQSHKETFKHLECKSIYLSFFSGLYRLLKYTLWTPLAMDYRIRYQPDANSLLAKAASYAYEFKNGKHA